MEFLVFFSIIVLALLAIDTELHTFDLIGFSVNTVFFSVCFMWMMDIYQKLNIEIEEEISPQNQIYWIIKLINTHFSDPLREWEIVYQKEIKRANDPES